MSRDVYSSRAPKPRSASLMDFIDLGCSTGGSYSQMVKRFGYERGLAIDIDGKKVKTARCNGVPAIHMDARRLSFFRDNSFRAVTMSYFLEHLPSRELIEEVLRESVRIGSETIYVRGRMFNDEALKDAGVRFFWSNWRGHQTHIEGEEVVQLLTDLGAHDIEVKYLGQVETTDDPCIHPLEAGKDRHAYDPAIDPPKPVGIPLEDIYQEYEIVCSIA